MFGTARVRPLPQFLPHILLAWGLSRINCPAFRLPGALMARHEAMLRAAAEALRPSPRFAALIAARRRAVAEAAGAAGYNLLHLRVEKDWLALCEWWQNPAEGRDNCMNNTATVGRELRKLGFPQEVGTGRKSGEGRQLIGRAWTRVGRVG